MEMRQQVSQKFYELVKNKKLASKIEESIYLYVISSLNREDFENPIDYYFKREYINKCVSLYDNINPISYIKNKELLKKIKKKDFDISKIAFMTPMELFPEHWNKLIEKKNMEKDILYSKKTIPISDRYHCYKCKKNECTYYQLQIRSSDEPMTTFITCLNCNNSWKQ